MCQTKPKPAVRHDAGPSSTVDEPVDAAMRALDAAMDRLKAVRKNLDEAVTRAERARRWVVRWREYELLAGTFNPVAASFVWAEKGGAGYRFCTRSAADAVRHLVELHYGGARTCSVVEVAA